MQLKTFEDLFMCLISDIYVVENQTIKEIPALIEKAYSDELKSALRMHLSETKEHVKRLDRVFKIINKKPEKLDWISDEMNLMADAETFVKDNVSSPLLDAAIIAIVQRIEHFEIATYGSLREFARVLDWSEVRDLLKETIKEEANADKLLTKLAEGGLFTTGFNETAAHR